MDGSLNNANHQVEVIDNEVRGKKWPDTSPDVLRRLQDIEKLCQQAHAQFLEINRLPTAYNYEIYFDQRLQLLQNLVQETRIAAVTGGNKSRFPARQIADDIVDLSVELTSDLQVYDDEFQKTMDKDRAQLGQIKDELDKIKDQLDAH